MPAQPRSMAAASRAWRLVLGVSLLVGAVFGPVPPTIASVPAGTAVQFDAANEYVTFGPAPSLGLSAFTVETWFRRTAAGSTASTGTGGINAIPLVTKGRGQAEASNLDMNWFLGIVDGTTDVLAVDFEDTAGGNNHPAQGTTDIPADGTWHHAAATYDGTTWRIYLDGNLEVTETENATPRSDSIQHAALGTALTSTGVAQGLFVGAMDEARVWNVARTQAQIQASMGQEMTSGTGLVARWGLSENTGATAGNSVAGGVSGTLQAGVTWVPGFSLAAEGAALSLPTTSFVTFGDPAKLDLAQFTIETWFQRTAAGSPISTGTGGISLVPLVTHGAPQAENSNVDANWILGIESTGNVIAADFEDNVDGTNHPVVGTTAIPVGPAWHHAAATYDGTTWRLFLDGRLDAELAVGLAPRSDTIQHAGLGTMLTSAGGTRGRFAGTLDEVRVWSAARSEADIRATINAELTSGAGLVARWGLDDGVGNTVSDSIAAPANGTLVGIGGDRVAGAPFDIDFTAPAAPTGLAGEVRNNAARLTWDANPEPDVAEYRIYRSSSSPVDTSGAPLATVAAPATAHVDTTATNGVAQFYAVTAVDADDNESPASPEVSVTPAGGNYGLDLGSDGAYVTFGDPAKLDLATFTIETWFKRSGIGDPNETGGSGIPALVPLVTHGAPQSEGSNVDANWILGINTDGNVLAADFEDSATGLNHPISGTTAIPADGEWHHAAATYDGTTWRLYLDGVIDGELVVGAFSPRADTAQHAGLGAMIRTDGSAVGRFAGVLDEARVWNHARTQLDIRTTISSQLTTGSGLVGRWGMNEGPGTPVTDSIATAANGTVTGSGYDWPAGSPFDLVFDTVAPSAPTGLSAEGRNGSVNLTWGTNFEADLAEYRIYRSETSPVGTSGGPLAVVTEPATTYVDATATNGTHYFYAITAVDDSSLESTLSTEVDATPAAGSYALDLGTNDAYVTLGDPAKLDLAQFTVETWFNRTGTGDPEQTGANGIAAFIPLVTHGAPEGDGSTIDANWVLGINTAGNVLAADFEDTVDGTNHPVSGTTAISSNAWHHAAATYDGTTWRLYLDGNLEADLTVGSAPRADSVANVGLGAMIESDGTPRGRFEGVLDEARVWNSARTLVEIRSAINDQLVSGTGLVARWAVDESFGTTVGDSVAPAAEGTITGAGSSWPDGAPFDLTFDGSAPLPPTGLTATPGNALVSLDWSPNSEPDLARYRVYRSTTSPVTTAGAPLAVVDAPASAYEDSSALNGTQYLYAVAAVDASGNPSLLSSEVSATPTAPPAAFALDLGSGAGYVTFGDPTELDLPQFTVETWFRKTGVGTPNTTGTGGIDILPLVTHGSPQDETGTNNANWMLGINSAGNVIAADFEDDATGLNHPVSGTTAIADGVWHHAAATYDGTTWRLYLDGALEATLVANATPRSDTVQHAGLGTMLETDGTANGHFQGAIDEARVWSVARTNAEIAGAMNSELTSGTGLVARWGLNEGSGTTVGDSVAPASDGAITGAGTAWAAGAPFNLPIPNAAPAVDAGPDQTLTQPDNVATLEAAVVDDGLPSPPATVTQTWTQESGPAVAVISAPSSATADVTLPAPGTYVFRITASDSADSDFDEVSVTLNEAAGSFALDFDGASDHVAFGTAPALGQDTFTIEAWVRRDGTGSGTDTGSGGIGAAVPLVTKGRSQTDTPATVNMNWFLGLDEGSGVLVADFEDSASGQNHPVIGATALALGTWYHVAATYNGTTWRLYLNGALDGQHAANATPEAGSIQHAALGTAMNSTGVADGRFDGVLDEVRVWDHARSDTQIAENHDNEIESALGLVARWGLNEGVGTSVGDSAGSGVTGTLAGPPAWVTGSPFQSTANELPDLPANPTPADDATGISTAPDLGVEVTDPDGDPLEVSFYGRPTTGTAGEPFTYLVMPDTQHYVDNPANLSGFTDQVEWIAENQDSLNIAFMSHLGDIVEHRDDVPVEWERASQQLSHLDTNNVPYGVAPGNHDISTTGVAANFDLYFPPSRYEAEVWYGGYMGKEPGDPSNRLNKNNYALFTAGGIDFLVIHFEVDYPDDTIEWAAGLLEQYPDRQAILSSHAFLSASGSRGTGVIHRGADGNSAEFVWQNLIRNHCNVFMVVNGHYSGEARRTDLNDCGEPVHQVVTDYQSRTNGGDSWLRYYTFVPEDDTIYAHTYAPKFGSFETDANSEFTLPYDMTGAAGFTLLGTDSVASGGTASVAWNGLSGGQEYEWYTVVNDGTASRTGDRWTFTTAGGANTSPTANPVAASAPEDTATAISLSGSDPETCDLTFSIVAGPSHGSLGPITNGACTTGSPNNDGASVTYTPAANYTGPDSFTYRVSDGGLDSAPATVTLTVNPANDAPLANAVSVSTPEDTATSVTLSGSDEETCQLTFSVLTQPAHGSLGVTSGAACTPGAPNTDTASVTYTPAANYNGPDSFTYRVSDGATNSPAATVTVTIDAANDLPTANPVSIGTTQDGPVAVGLSGSDVETCQLTFSVVTAPAHGSLGAIGAAACSSGTPNTDAASVTYTPAAGYSGPDSFSYRVNDGTADSAPATVSITVAPVGGPGIALRATASGANTGTASLLLPVPSGVLNGDLLVAGFTVRGNPTITAPAGWTLVRSDLRASTMRQVIYIHRVVGGEPANYTWTFSANAAAVGVVAAYSGVDATTPIDAHGGLGNSSSTQITAPSISTSLGGTLLVGLHSMPGKTTIAPPAGMSERVEIFSANGVSNKLTLALSDQPWPPSGATGTRIATGGKSAVSIGQLLALRPAGDSGGGTGAPGGRVIGPMPI